MYIRFRLVFEGSAPSPNFLLNLIQQEIAAWAERYSVRYTQKTIKNEHRVAFDRDETYTLWSMTWDPVHKHTYGRWLDYEMVNVAGERY